MKPFKYKIWQIADIDYKNPGKLISLKNKIDRSDDMYISPEGKFMVFGRNDDDEYTHNWYIMEQSKVYFELEILE